MLAVKALIDLIGIGHDFANGTSIFSGLEHASHIFGGFFPLGLQDAFVALVVQLAIEIFADEVGGTACDVDVLADQVTVDAGNEILGVEINVFDLGIELGRNVVAQPFGVHADVQIAKRRNAGATAFGHFLAADGNEPVNIQLVGRLAAGKLKCGGPEERVEVHNILADEMHLLGVAIGVNQRVVIQSDFFAISFQRSQVTNGSVQPDIKIFAWRIRDFNAEIRRVTRDVPVSELGFALSIP